MQSHRLISLGSILVMLLIPVIGWFLIAQPQIAAAAAADGQRAQLDAANQASTAAVAQLAADSKHLPELNDQLDELRSSIPADIDSSAYIDGLNALAAVSGVQISGLTVADPVAYTPAVAQATAGAVAPTPAATDAPAGAAAPPPPPDPAIVTNALITPASFVTIPVTLQITGGYPSILAFIHGLQTGGRLFLVSTLATAQEDGGISAKIGGFIYAVPTGLPGNPHPTSTTVKIMDAGLPADTPDDGTTGDGTSGDGTGTSPTPNPTTTP